MLVAIPQPFDFGLTLERFRSFGPDPAGLWLDGAFHRVLASREVRLEPAPGGVRVDPADPDLVEPVRRFLGSSFDLEGFDAFAERDPVLAQLASRLRGLRPTLVPDPFEALVTSITSQQISLHAALAIRSRLVQRYGRRVGRAHAFPERAAVARAKPDKLVALGFSRRKADYVVGLARSPIDLEALAALADEEVANRLLALPGIGRWTVDWFLARHLGRPDAWPAGDLGLRKAVAAFYLEGGPVSVEETRAFGERFAPYRNLAAHYLLVGLRVGPP